MLGRALIIYAGSLIGSILGSNKDFGGGTLVGLELGETYVVPLGNSGVRVDGVRIGEDLGMIYGRDSSTEGKHKECELEGEVV